jgi:hypothetical protein
MNRQMKLLKMLRKSPLRLEEVCTRLDLKTENEFNFLIATNDMINYIIWGSDQTCTLTAAGEALLDAKYNEARADWRRWRINFLLAVLSAVCGSALTLIVEGTIMKWTGLL